MTVGMRIYFNTSALNRPFDDLSLGRVRLDAEAVAALLERIEGGALEWVSSDYVDFEVTRDPDHERARRIQSLMGLVTRRVEVSDALVRRARDLERSGLRGLDALHLASAEAAGADLVVTTDDRMIRRGQKATAGLSLQVVSPPEALSLLERRPGR